MSLNKLVPQPLNKTVSKLSSTRPDQLNQSEPFLETPDRLSVDCEISQNWKGVDRAFESEDKGRVFGRGRNIQAIFNLQRLQQPLAFGTLTSMEAKPRIGKQCPVRGRWTSSTDKIERTASNRP